MQTNDTFQSQLIHLYRKAFYHLQIAEGIFKTLTALNFCPNDAEDDDETSKKFAKDNELLILDFTTEYKTQIEELEKIDTHPALNDLKELSALSDALKCLMVCIGSLGNDGSAGVARAGEYMIHKLKKQLEIHFPEELKTGLL